MNADLILDCSHTRQVAENIYWFHPEVKHKIVQVLNGVSVPRVPYNIVVGSKRWQELMVNGETQFKYTPWKDMYGSDNPPLNKGEILGFIHWATDCDFYTPGNEKKEDYLLWSARPSPYKGLHTALKLAVDLQFPLKILMPVKSDEHIFFSGKYSEVIQFAQKKNPKIEVVHLPENSQHHILKRELYRKAKALLITVETEEPFGLTTVESLSCGTPVIAPNMGAFPEIIMQDCSGYLCNTYEDYKSAIQSIGKIYKYQWLVDTRNRFHYLRAAEEYIKLAEKMRCTKNS